MKLNSRVVRVLWGVAIFLTVLAIATSIRRGLFVTGVIERIYLPGVGWDSRGFDTAYRQYPGVALFHLIPGVLFMALGPFQFMQRFRARNLQRHRWFGRVFVASGVVVGISAYVMAFRMAVGGINETIAGLFYANIFMFSLGKAFYHIRRREIAQHREWMIRVFSLGMAVGTIRPVVLMFYNFTSSEPQEFFGTALWISFTAHLIAAEIWIHLTRPKAHAAQAPLAEGERPAERATVTQIAS
jgi:uncharacterized membrane protein